ncbi:MAG: alpha/beta hydrolase [Pseudomonadota bacterium]
MSERTIQNGTVELAVREAGAGPVLVWGHGLVSSMASEDALDWFDWSAMSATARLLRYDARGHGQSGAAGTPEEYHWRVQGQDMLAVAGQLNAPRFIAAGASMGAMSALYAALLAPERVTALVLVIPPTIWDSRKAQAAQYQMTARAGRILGAAALTGMMQRSLARSLPHWLVEAEARQLQGAALGLQGLARRTLWNLFRGTALSDLPPPGALAPLAAIPALILGWDGDATHPVASAELLHRLLPQSELFIAVDYAGFKTIARRMREFVDAQRSD